jgi:hypothetical protein
LCEKSCGGVRALRLFHCARVSGSTSGPTFATTAARPASNSVFSAPIDGCSAKVRPVWRVFGTISSTPPAWPGSGSVIGAGATLRARV